MLEVSERRTEPAQRPGDRPQHAGLLEAGRHVHCLDARRDEVGPPRQSREAKVTAGELRQALEQVRDVRLVARPLTAEHVGVDDDQGHAQAAASR